MPDPTSPLSGLFWTDPLRGLRLDPAAALERMAAAQVVLLGETHDDAEDHLWQAGLIARLAERRPVVAGLEMVPRAADPALARWVEGGMDLPEMLAATRWSEAWGFDPGLYRPIFEVCRDLGVEMRGLNIPRPLVSAIGRDGWDAVPEADRGWFSPATPASPDYRRYLFEVTGGARPGRQAQSPEDPAFDRFVRAQQAWDRAFACALAAALRDRPEALAVGIIGRGHLEYRLGVPPQLAALGVESALVLLRSAPPQAGPIADMVGPKQPEG